MRQCGLLAVAALQLAQWQMLHQLAGSDVPSCLTSDPVAPPPSAQSACTSKQAPQPPMVRLCRRGLPGGSAAVAPASGHCSLPVWPPQKPHAACLNGEGCDAFCRNVEEFLGHGSSSRSCLQGAAAFPPSRRNIRGGSDSVYNRASLYHSSPFQTPRNT